MAIKDKVRGKSSRVRTGLTLGAIVLLVVVLGSMLVGIVGGGATNTANRPANVSNSTGSGVSDQSGMMAASATTAAMTSAAAGTTAAATTAASAAIPANGSTAKNPAAQSTSTGQTLPADRLIIRNATVSLSAQDVDKTVMELRALATEKNGLVFASTSQTRDDKTYANLTIQVPAAAFDETMNRVHRLSGVKVEDENTTSQDVTEEYVDVQAQLTNLKATEAELTRLLTKTNSVPEILSVQSQVSNVRGQIDRLQGRLNYLDKRTSMSNIVFTIAPVALPARVEPSKGWDAGQVFDTAWAGSVRGLQGLFKLAVTVGVWAIWIGPLLALLVVLVVIAYRRLFPRRPGQSVVPTLGSDNAA